MDGNFTDLHTHILPAVDDGAEDLDVALKLLQRQKEKGIHRVALTPHFYPFKESLEDFLHRREKAYSVLMREWDSETMPAVQLGAEVRFSPLLASMDLRQLTIGGGNYLLLELPEAGAPTHIEKGVDIMQAQGITPILAHVERCAYFRQRPMRLLELVRAGALAQLSTRAFEVHCDRKFAELCLKRGLAHILASDVHRLNGRAPLLGNTVKTLTTEEINRAEEFAKAVWDNAEPPSTTATPVYKGFFGYY